MAAETQTIAALGRALRARQVTAEAVTEQCLARIAEQDGRINAFITTLADDAREQARALDRELASGGDRGPLHGVPISLKDLIDVRGLPTTAASRVRRDHVATADAAVVARLRDAGAIFIGKTNLHEFALGTTNEDSAYGPVKHPLDPARSPGGSSGGSAASVLAHMAYASIGTDTGGSIRIPSAACGLVGLKPALGDISTLGVVPLSTTMDHVGPLCRSVEDATLLFDVLSGTTCAGAPPTGHSTPRLAVLGGYLTELLDAQVASTFEGLCDRLRQGGATLEEVTLAHASDVAAVYVHIVLSEAAAFHAKTLESRGDDYTPPVRQRLEMGRYILAEDYVRALHGRRLLRAEVDALLETREALLLPTLPMPATKLGATTVRLGTVDEPVRSATLRLTQLFNITGHPAITLPCGKTADGLPIGMQLVGREARALLRTAAGLERYFGPGMS